MLMYLMCVSSTRNRYSLSPLGSRMKAWSFKTGPGMLQLITVFMMDLDTHSNCEGIQGWVGWKSRVGWLWQCLSGPRDECCCSTKHDGDGGFIQGKVSTLGKLGGSDDQASVSLLVTSFAHCRPLPRCPGISHAQPNIEVHWVWRRLLEDSDPSQVNCVPSTSNFHGVYTPIVSL